MQLLLTVLHLLLALALIGLFGLVITADCGISNGAEIAELKRAGIETIVTDHHLPPARLPAPASSG